jgi:hypothetical protein
VISRRRCLRIAEQWQLNHGLKEYERRRADVFRPPSWWPYDPEEHPHLSVEQVIKLEREMAKAVLDGYYDPPFPKIPNFFERLRINDWTPPEVDWPMNTEKAHERT